MSTQEHEHKGWIALDIDGTITHELHKISDPVIACLESLSRSGWQLVFITGRTLSFALSPLSVLQVPFLLAVQNGADLLSFPQKKSLKRSYLPSSITQTLETLYAGQEEDFLIYSGYEKGDFCYYRPHRFSSHLLPFLTHVKTLCLEPWKELSHFASLEGESFPLIKCVGSYAVMKKVHDALCTSSEVAISMIKEPSFSDLYLNLITSPQATKGEVLKKLVAGSDKRGVVIAAGDDFNDVSMLQVADIPIVIETAPEEVRALAKILAKPPKEKGIIDALLQATSFTL